MKYPWQIRGIRQQRALKCLNQILRLSCGTGVTQPRDTKNYFYHKKKTLWPSVTKTNTRFKNRSIHQSSNQSLCLSRSWLLWKTLNWQKKANLLFLLLFFRGFGSYARKASHAGQEGILPKKLNSFALWQLVYRSPVPQAINLRAKGTNQTHLFGRMKQG